jgi:glucokinase
MIADLRPIQSAISIQHFQRLECPAMLLAGDVGGTKTLLGLFTARPDRPSAIDVGEFTTLDYSGLEPMIESFLKSRDVESRHIEAASFGVAGAVTDQVARLTNVPWLVEGESIKERLGIRRSYVLNDLEAMAYGVTVLEQDELSMLQRGVPHANGNAAVIAAGTGLGEAMLLNVNGRFIPGPSEGGHADFAPRTPREIDLLRELTRIYGRVSVEAILSGPGLVNVYQFTHQSFGTEPGVVHIYQFSHQSPGADRTQMQGSVLPSRLCDGVGHVSDPAELPAHISRAGMERRCARCVEALDIFVSVYGAESGNIALRTVATAGVYVGGGIAPKILPALESGVFLDAFRAKEPMADFVATIPIAVILNPDAGLLGAAVHAQEMSVGA